jgi:hypothetical protein
MMNFYGRDSGCVRIQNFCGGLRKAEQVIHAEPFLTCTGEGDA